MEKGGKNKPAIQRRGAWGVIQTPQEFWRLKLEGEIKAGAWEQRRPRQDRADLALTSPKIQFRPTGITPCPGSFVRPPLHHQNWGLAHLLDPDLGVFLHTWHFWGALSIPRAPRDIWSLAGAAACRDALAFPALSYLVRLLCKEFGAPNINGAGGFGAIRSPPFPCGMRR